MKTREEQLAEMAKHLCSSFNSEYCHHDCPEFCDCRVLVHCEGLQYAGYRKQSDTAREIAEMLKAAKAVVKVHFEAYDELIENIVEKYGVEVEK